MKTFTFAVTVATAALASSALGQQRPTDKPEIPATDGAVFASTILIPAAKEARRALQTVAPAGIRQ